MKQEPVAGVDVSKRFSDMCILSPTNKVFAKVKIYHDLTSMQKSLETLHQAENAFGIKPVIVMESTSHYHVLLCQFMRRAGYEWRNRQSGAGRLLSEKVGFQAR